MDPSRKQLISELKAGISAGRALIQLETAPWQVKEAIQEILDEGFFCATAWQYNVETKEIYRVITAKPLLPNQGVRKDGYSGLGSIRVKWRGVRPRGPGRPS